MDTRGLQSGEQPGAHGTVLEGVERNLSELLHRYEALHAAHAAHDRGRESPQDGGVVAASWDVGVLAYSLLRVLHDRGSTRPSDAVLVLDFERTAVSRCATRLERQGLITRIPDPKDARARLLCLTPRGRSIVLRVRTEKTHVLNLALATSTGPDIRELTRFLNRLTGTSATREHKVVKGLAEP
ncbi:MarR family winged helix-turn-helix transcriptional regulator [Arthrobacter agilis]|uniref:MarR family winged helix-turn-helix transcriptional regulator n=1 Tax=Arthrobacter agilis TaxID=37921 RepID=UPI003B67F62D